MKTAVITGATSGIGVETAKLLAQNGYRVIGIGRNDERCKIAEESVRTESGSAEVVYFKANLMNQREINRAAKEISDYIEEKCDGELYALINNAGCARGYYMTTEEGYEHQFALNYLAGFLLTYRLLPYLKKASGRVIMTSSKSHRGCKVHWKDVMFSKKYRPLMAYKQSKLCDVLFAKGLNDRYNECGIHAYAVDPGLVKTDIGNKNAGGLVNFIWSLRKLGGVSPKIPAKTYAYICNQESAPEDLYWYLCKKRAYNKQVTSENADRLFELGEKLCGISYNKEN